MKMIDFHAHILPALDDGAVTVDDSIAMAKALSAFGYKTVCCTPHCIKGYYDLTPQKVREATLMLQADLDNAEVQLDLWPGMEYMLDECFAEFAEDLLPLGDTKLVLCEAPPQAHPGYVKEGLELIISKGFVPLVAHPERTPYFYEELMRREARSGNREESEKLEKPEKLDKSKSQSFLKRLFAPRTSHLASPDSKPKIQNSKLSDGDEFPSGVLFHANLGSFTGFYGQQVQRKAYELLKLGVYTAMASDLHDGRSANQVLVYDKFAMNPIVKKLAEFDGTVPEATQREGGRTEEQGSLF